MNLESYRNRFYNLLESELGNVKPLINEQAQPTSKLDNIDWSKENVGANFKPKEQPKPTTTLKNVPNITKGQTPGTLKLCTQTQGGQKCLERQVKVCYGKFCLGITFDTVKIRPDNGDLYALIRPTSKFVQKIFQILPKKFTDSFLTPNGAIQFQGDAKGVNYAVQQISQGVANVQIPIGFGVYAVII